MGSLRRFRIGRRAILLSGAGLLSFDGLSAHSQVTSSEIFSRNLAQDACPSVDPAYIQTANETGGIPMFLQRSEVAKAFHLVRESTRSNVATVLRANGVFDGTAQTFNIPVDSETKRITFAFSVDTKGGRVTLTQPSGGSIVPGTANTEITELHCGRIVTVAPPESGIWHAEIAGSGRFWIEAQAQSDIHFISAEFVKLGGRPGHEGLFRITGQPLAGTSATLQVSLSAKDTDSTEFRLVTERGDTIQQVQMDVTSSDPQFLEFVGSFECPRDPFRVAVTGRDPKGQTYQRFFSTLFHAETVEVLPGNELDGLLAGHAQQISFAVRNAGASAKFKVTVTDAKHFVSQIVPSELTLGAGEPGTIRVDLTVPAGTAPGIGDDIIVVVSSITGPASSNSSVMHVSVSSPSSH